MADWSDSTDGYFLPGVQALVYPLPRRRPLTAEVIRYMDRRKGTMQDAEHHPEHLGKTGNAEGELYNALIPRPGAGL